MLTCSRCGQQNPDDASFSSARARHSPTTRSSGGRASFYRDAGAAAYVRRCEAALGGEVESRQAQQL